MYAKSVELCKSYTGLSYNYNNVLYKGVDDNDDARTATFECSNPLYFEMGDVDDDDKALLF